MLKKKIIKFGKSFKDVDEIKKDFFLENKNLLFKQDRLNKLYLLQPKRIKCKACNAKLGGSFFLNHGIKYFECKKCTHINGYHQDTHDFTNKIYINEKTNYSKSYHETNLKKFLIRQKKIYDPKAVFLKNSFKNHKKIKVLDIGAGSGYFLSSLLDCKFSDAKGVEVSRKQVEFGKKIFLKLKKNPNTIENLDFKNIINLVKKTDFECISLIGVLEHMTDMSVVMKAIQNNKKIKYIYVLVPMSSFICVVENIFSKIFNRHLGGGHTHLFTERSLLTFMKKYRFIDHSAWWFGTDIHDFYRSLILEMGKKNYKPLQNIIYNMKNIIDSLQLELDKKKISSEVHMLLKRK